MNNELRAKPVNVLCIIWSLGLGGAERVVINLAKGLDKSKFNPVVCCLNDKGIFAEELEKEGIKVIPLNKKPGLDISVIKKIYRIIKDNEIEIAHTHLWGANFWGRIAAKIAKVPVIIATEHNSDTWKNPLHFVLDRWLSHSSDKIIAVSNSVKDFYVRKGISPLKVEVIYNGIETSSDIRHKRYDIRKEFNIKDDETILAVIGRLVPQKGHRYLFEALHSLDGRYRLKLLVVGDGPLKSELQSIVYNLQLEQKVIFTGLRQDVPELLKAVDILVMPSLREGMTLVALEAMSAGVPVVATNTGGIPEIISDGKTGILVPKQNAELLKNAISKLISDRKLASTISQNAVTLVREKFSIEKMIENTQCLYEELYQKKAVR